MRNIFITLFLLVSCNLIFAQQNINFHMGTSTDSYQLNESDSLYFDEDHTILYFFNDGTTIQNALSNIDSITFTIDESNNVYIEYLETSVNVTNPLSGSGVTVDVDGAFVTVNSAAGIQDINYICTGTTSNGMLKIYSDEKFNLLLNDVNITNPVGPAINIQSEKKATISLLAGTNNLLTDGEVYDDPLGSEDQKAALFSEGKMKFIGSGSLNVFGNGEDKHSICSDKEMTIYEGNITVVSGKKDGIHADGFVMNGGMVEITSAGDGIDGDEDQIEINCGSIIINSTSDDVKGISCDSTLTINGGDVVLNISGDQSKGLKSDMNIFLYGGTISGTASGDVVLEDDNLGYNPSYCSMIKAEQDLIIDGATIDITTTGEASRGISCDGNFIIQSGMISIVSSGDGDTYTNSLGDDDAYHGACIKVDGDLTINDGVVSVSNSGSGGKGISCDGSITFGDGFSQPEMEVVTTGTRITITPGGGGGGGGNNGDYDEAKAIKADISVIVNSGDLNISSADDGIKAGESITFNNGVVIISESEEGVEAPNITVNDGELRIYAEDDGFNATYGNGGEQNDGSQLTFNGGYCYVNSSGGDAIDSNGDLTVTGGTTIVHGAASQIECGIDVNGGKLISGGFFIVSMGNSWMNESFDSGSSQKSLFIKSNQSIGTNTIIHLEDADGDNIFTFKPERNYYSVVFSSPDLENGSGYKLYTGGSSTGTVTDGLYVGGSYSPGTLETTFSISGSVTNVNF